MPRQSTQQIFIVVRHFLCEYSTWQPKPHREPAALRRQLGFQTQRATDRVAFARFALMSNTEWATDRPGLATGELKPRQAASPSTLPERPRHRPHQTARLTFNRLARRIPSRFQLRRNRLSPAEIDLVRRLPGECRMRNRRVVLRDIERNVTANCRGRLEPVQVVLELAPPALDHRVRESHVHESADTAEQSVTHERIHLAVEILYAAVGHHRRAVLPADGVANRFVQDRDRVGNLETFGYTPSQDPTAEVVDDSVEPDFRPINQAHGLTITTLLPASTLKP